MRPVDRTAVVQAVTLAAVSYHSQFRIRCESPALTNRLRNSRGRSSTYPTPWFKCRFQKGCIDLFSPFWGDSLVVLHKSQAIDLRHAYDLRLECVRCSPLLFVCGRCSPQRGSNRSAQGIAWLTPVATCHRPAGQRRELKVKSAQHRACVSASPHRGNNM